MSAFVDRLGFVQEFDVALRVVAIERHFIFEEANGILSQPGHPDFPLLDHARQVASRLRPLRLSGFHIGREGDGGEDPLHEFVMRMEPILEPKAEDERAGRGCSSDTSARRGRGVGR